MNYHLASARVLLFVPLLLLALTLTACRQQHTKDKRVTSLQEQAHFAEWTQRMLVGEYDRVGKKSDAWDADVRKALEMAARIRIQKPELEDSMARMNEMLTRARQAGCNDELVEYLWVKTAYGGTNLAKSEEILDWVKAADGMLASEYAPVRKFYASIRAAQTIAATLKKGDPNSQSMNRMREAATTNCLALLEDDSTSILEVYDVIWELIRGLDRIAVQRAHSWDQIEPVLLRKWSKHFESWLLKGWFYTTHAWQVRGKGDANTFTAEDRMLFEERLAIAAESLEKAWDLGKDERIAILMMTVELGQGQGSKRHEMWFARAMALNPNSYEAAEAEFIYLLPRWYGSEEELLQFGKACVASTNWGGYVPFILTKVHDELAQIAATNGESPEKYWLRYGVWDDLHNAYTRLFKLNPEATRYHHNYALAAWKCHQWDELNRQIPLLGEVNYGYFGGKPAYERMIREAKEHEVQSAK